LVVGTQGSKRPRGFRISANGTSHGQTLLDVGILNGEQALAHNAYGRNGRQTLFGIVAMRLDVFCHERFEQLESLGTQPALFQKDLP
jgi:hypothetical protein